MNPNIPITELADNKGRFISFASFRAKYQDSPFSLAELARYYYNQLINAQRTAFVEEVDVRARIRTLVGGDDRTFLQMIGFDEKPWEETLAKHIERYPIPEEIFHQISRLQYLVEFHSTDATRTITEAGERAKRMEALEPGLTELKARVEGDPNPSQADVDQLEEAEHYFLSLIDVVKLN